MSLKRKVQLCIVLIFVIFIAFLVIFCAISYSENRNLRAALTETEEKLRLREDTARALEAQQNEQKTIIQQLQDKIQDLMNVEEPEPVITSDQLEEQLSSIRELVTKQYTYTNAARREANKTWLWGWDMPFSDTSLLVTYDGVIRAGIDLNDVKITVDENSRTITVILPASRVIDNNIPQETINVLEARDGLFNRITFDDYNKFISDEKKAMEEKAINMGVLADADAEAKAIIRAFLDVLPGMDTYNLVIESPA